MVPLRSFLAGYVVLVAGVMLACGGSESGGSQGSNSASGATSRGGSASGGSGSGSGGTVTCPAGAETCACYGNDTCNAGLTCASHLCVRLGSGGASSFGGTSAVATGGGAVGITQGSGGTYAMTSTSISIASGGQVVIAASGGSVNSTVAVAVGCGDGQINQSSESCDDGNTLAGDGCNGICKVEANHLCPNAGQACLLNFRCGDGVVNPGEVCDQGIYQGSPGCSADCTKQDSGYRCKPSSQCIPWFVCGNRRIEAGESCDPPNPGNGCDGKCQREVGWRCKPGSCVKLPRCGDGIVQADLGETCDQGTYQGNPGCSSDCRAQDAACVCTPGAKCQCPATTCGTGGCPYGNCSAVPAEPCCGDGLVQLQFGETCDNGASNGNTTYGGCAGTCKLNAFCGDAIVNGTLDHPELCDDGINDGSYGTCGVGCAAPPTCGDGVLQSDWAEECEPAASRDPNCTVNCRLPGYCGDGMVDSVSGEACDQGVANNSGEYGGCNPNCAFAARCGDGVTNGPEQCDDGLLDGSYGTCTAQCLWAPRCGDGSLQPAYEQCDNGSRNGHDGLCSSTCKRLTQ